MSRNNIRTQPLYIPNMADPTLFNEPESAWRYPGMIGGKCTIVYGTEGSATNPRGSKTIQLVRTDSTMTTNPYASAVAWWANRQTYQVTTVPTNRRGQVAGVFQNAVTPGNLALIVTNGRRAVKFVDAPTATPTAAGLIVIPSATAAKADCLAAGSAATYPAIGRSAGTYNEAETLCLVDIDIPEVS